VSKQKQFKYCLEKCAVPELKAYCYALKIDYTILILLDNAPGHPICVGDLSENIKFVFMPPNTTSIIQPIDQGLISNFYDYL